MTFARFTGAVFVCAVLLAGPALADPAETAKAAGKDASWLLIQTAQSAKFDGTTLTLENVSPSVIMFTGRPARMAEALPIATVVAGWDKGGAKSFKADPPNAGLTSIVDGKLQTATVKLREPRLDGTTLTYKAQVTQGALPAAGQTVSLFIDDSCLSCF